jgi:hypothetical protein
MIKNTLEKTNNVSKFIYFKDSIDPSFITFEDVADYFIPPTTLNVELVQDNKKLQIPRIGIYQDKNFILDKLKDGATFCIFKYINPNARTFRLFEEVCDYYTDKSVDFHLYGSITETSKSFPAHNDLATNFIVQLEGQCEWVIYNETASYEEAYNYFILPEDKLTEETRVIVNPGDILYIPSGKYHKCIPLGKRLSLSIPIL